MPETALVSIRKTEPESRHTFRATNDTRSKCVEEKKYQGYKWSWYHSSTTVPILFERYLHEIALWIKAFFPLVASAFSSFKAF